MLATRIIPTLLCRGRTLIKGKQFNSWRSVGNVGQAVRVHAARGVDELALLDIGATWERRGHDLGLIAELGAVMTTPLAVGGGINEIEQIKELLRHGADKVVIGAAAYRGFVEYAAFKVGRQAIIAAVDFNEDGQVFTNGGLGYAPELDPKGYAQMLEFQGAGEILLTSVTREGMMNGYDLEVIRKVTAALDIPVIAHGGCGTPQHMLEAIQAGAAAVAAGAMFQFTDHTPASCAKYLAEHGVEVRLQTEEEPCR